MGMNLAMAEVITHIGQNDVIIQGRRRRGAGGARAPPPLSKVGGTSGFVPPPPPPPLLGRANVISSLFAHIMWLKT